MSRSAFITMSAWAANSPPRNCSAKSRWATSAPADAQTWRVVRARNKWQPNEDCARHPVPGTYPVVITGEAEWGGWRVPGAEYDLDPGKMEEQARLIASAPKLAAFAIVAGGLGAQVGRGHAQRAGRTGARGAGPAHRGQAQRLMTLHNAQWGSTRPWARSGVFPCHGCLWCWAASPLLTVIFFWPWVAHLSTALIGPPEDNMQDFWNSCPCRRGARSWRDFVFTRQMRFPEGTSLAYARLRLAASVCRGAAVEDFRQRSSPPWWRCTTSPCWPAFRWARRRCSIWRGICWAMFRAAISARRSPASSSPSIPGMWRR